MGEIIQFAPAKPRKPLSSKEAALKISGMSNGAGASSGIFEPLKINPNLCGSDDDFGESLFSVRAAILICRRDGAGVREVVESLGDLDLFMRSLDDGGLFRPAHLDCGARFRAPQNQRRGPRARHVGVGRVRGARQPRASGPAHCCRQLGPSPGLIQAP